MKITYIYSAVVFSTLLALPHLSLAADPSLQSLIVGTNSFVNAILIPAVLAIAFLVFVINVVRFFIIGGANEEGQRNAKALALYSVGAFVFILSFWGIVNLLNEGIGLDNTPCDNFTNSDYVDRGLDPCTSIRPVARPDGLVPPNPTTDDGSSGFGTGAESSGSGFVAPGGDSVPSQPQPPTPPTSFDPDGNPFGSSLAQLQTAQAALQAPVTAFLASENEAWFGYNADVTEELFATLLGPVSADNSTTDQAAAAYRLNQLGAISSADFNAFIAAINTHDAAIGTPRPPLTVSALASQTLPLSAAAQAHITTTQSLIAAEVNDYNERVAITGSSNQEDVNFIIATLYDRSVSISERRDRLDAIFDNPDAQIIIDDTGEIYDRFNDDLNMEALFINQISAID